MTFFSALVVLILSLIFVLAMIFVLLLLLAEAKLLLPTLLALLTLSILLLLFSMLPVSESLSIATLAPLSLPWPAGIEDESPPCSDVLRHSISCFFHFVRRFWNQVLICTSD